MTAQRRRGRLRLGFALALAILACSSGEERIAEQREQARTLLAQGRDDEALRAFRAVLRLAPQDAESNLEIARIADRLGRRDDALFFYREAYRLDPRSEEAALAEARLLVEDDPDAAEVLVNAILERHADSVLARVRRAEILLARDDRSGARAVAEEAIALDEASGEAWLQLARVRRADVAAGQGAAPDALAVFERAAALLPARGAVTALLERAEFLAERAESAGTAPEGYRRAVERAVASGERPLVREATSGARAYARRSQDRDLLRFALERLVASDEANLAAWSELARLEQIQNRTGDAIFRRLLERRPEDGEARERYAAFLVRHDRPDEARRMLDDALAAGVAPPIVLAALLDVAYATHDPEAAHALLERMQREFPAHERTALALARRRLEEGDAHAAAVQLRELVGAGETARVQHLLATAELRRGDLLAARAAVDRAIGLSSEFAPASERLLARIQFASEDWVDGLRTLRRLEEEGSMLAPAELVERAQALYAIGRQPAGRQLLESLARGEEPFPPALAELARREHDRDPKRIRELVEAAFARHPDRVELATELARIEAREGHPQRALELLDQAARGGDAPPDLLLLRARVLVGLEDWKRAEGDFVAAFRAAPGQSEPRSLLVAFYEQRQRLEEAIPLFEEADARGALPPEGLETLARLYLRRGDDEAAVRALERALAATSELPGAKNDLAFLLARHGGDLDRALRLAQEANEALGDLPPVADTLGYVYLQKNLHEPAIAQFQQAIALARRSGADHPSYHYHLGLALRRRGDEDAAAQALDAALALGQPFDGIEDARVQLEAARAAAAAPSGG